MNLYLTLYTNITDNKTGFVDFLYKYEDVRVFCIYDSTGNVIDIFIN